MDRRKALQKTGLFAGATFLMPSMLSLFESCKSENRLDWKPLFFTDVEANTIASLVDKILPRTDTPGALDVKSDIFIDTVIAKSYDKAGQEHMRADIAAFNENCSSKYGDVFYNLSDDDKTAVLNEAEKSSGKFGKGVWGTGVGPQEEIGFYRSMKSMAIWAYMTSEEIGKNVLNYDPVPGEYEPCKPLSEVGNKWSLG
ncbi:gluconate 2-dehydrogenase subunit 3 family protein [Maribacter confluentis]|uniref:Gluconate 2-dehydrogenase subunit 3 family protein n=1 Tax=Maribacter confluentis TaxID=1656093 RepID=A0ABT8RKF9_9FLAO|nr:gluconate 2-dehydrogenase subunit 3 family protein [Maribacter confluentis]MDO1511466.1 gluconate 2-dehydrogenase subunit 3 family protein [Maribacter confluentis]